jgi:hypothetical protein
MGQPEHLDLLRQGVDVERLEAKETSVRRDLGADLRPANEPRDPSLK